MGDDIGIPETGAVFTFGRSRFSDNQPSHFFIRNDPVVHISCGDEHTVLICQKGRAFAFGTNGSGQLGLGHTKAVDKPTCIKAIKPSRLKLAACGKAHTLLASTCGRVFACGANGDGQLGLGDCQDRLGPQQLSLDLPEGGQILALAAGCLHSALLTEQGEVLTWGCNSDGQCGLGDAGDSVLIPTRITFMSPVTSIACGYYHTAVICGDSVWTMGEGDSGQLGVEGSHATPQRVPLPEEGEEPSLPVKVAAGGSHTLVLTDKGEVYGFGSNFSGQLGDEPSPSFSKPIPISIPKPVINISSGESHSAFLTEDGELWTVGDARHGKLCRDPDAEKTSQLAAVQVLLAYRVEYVSCGGCHTMVLALPRNTTTNHHDPDGEVVCSDNAPTLPPLKTRVLTNENGASPPEGSTPNAPLSPDGGKKRGEEGEGDSLTESCNGAEATPPCAEPATPQRGDEICSKLLLHPGLDVQDEQEIQTVQEVTPPPPKSRLQKLVNVLRGRSAPSVNGKIDGHEEKIGNQASSKTCAIL